MEKKLYELFDEATPSELDQFAEELQASELEYAALSSIKNKVYVKTKLAHCYNEKGRIITMKKEIYKNLQEYYSKCCLFCFDVCMFGRI